MNTPQEQSDKDQSLTPQVPDIASTDVDTLADHEEIVEKAALEGDTGEFLPDEDESTQKRFERD